MALFFDKESLSKYFSNRTFEIVDAKIYSLGELEANLQGVSSFPPMVFAHQEKMLNLTSEEGLSQEVVVK